MAAQAPAHPAARAPARKLESFELTNAPFGRTQAGRFYSSFAPGANEFTGDTLVEGFEHFFRNLSNPVNTVIADSQGIGTIVDNDALVLLTEPNSQRALAFDSVTLTRDPFSIATDRNLSSDNVRRISLTVEFVGTVPSADWLTQIVVKLNGQLQCPAFSRLVKSAVWGKTTQLRSASCL